MRILCENGRGLGLVTIYFIKLPEAVMPYLEQNPLDDWTYNKAAREDCRNRFRGGPGAGKSSGP